jgi:hypothetical protein
MAYWLEKYLEAPLRFEREALSVLPFSTSLEEG